MQGGSFTSARFIIVEDGNSGLPLQEFTIKSHIANEKLPCKPHFRKTIDYFSWKYTAKVCKLNDFVPKNNGDLSDVNSLKYLTRRFIFLNIENSFTSNIRIGRNCSKIFLRILCRVDFW